MMQKYTAPLIAPKVHISDFTPLVMASLYSLPEAVAQEHVRDVMIEMARKTGILKRVAHADLGSHRCTATVVLHDECVELCQIEEVQYPHCGKLEAVRCVNDVECTARSYFFEKPYLWVNPSAGDCAIQLELLVQVIPAQDACEFDAILYEKYKAEITAAAVGRALDMPSAEWYNPSAARLAKNNWSRVMSEASVMETRGQMRAPLQPQLVRFV